jgi:ATP-binding cassette subfamily F protein 3
VVSHNRHFVSQVANKIWYIEDQQIKEYPGTYEEYEYWRKKNLESGAVSEPVKKAASPKPAPVSTAVNPNEKKLKELNRDLKKTEEKIQKLEEEITVIEQELAKPDVYGNPARLNEVQQQFEKARASLQAQNTTWDALAMEIEELEKR